MHSTGFFALVFQQNAFVHTVGLVPNISRSVRKLARHLVIKKKKNTFLYSH